ncbi:hypothetical protein N7486_009802 [Penicillium sp. IBT 16267x]|nr:hypothetical protein N7486_009802 [Penicillium sp. IBT 16267x]
MNWESDELGGVKTLVEKRWPPLYFILSIRYPVNRQREAVGGIPKIGREVDYSALTRGARHARTNLLAGTGLGQGRNLLDRNKRPRPNDDDEAMGGQA